ncbi:MAG: secretion protein F [Acutalibacteraceae bacterium]|nr:secretion protein F [Acutalibacteraceae bacterium]
MLQIITGILVGVGMMYILLDTFKVPYLKTSKSVKTVSKKQREKTSSVDVWLGGIANSLAKIIRINEYKRAELLNDLRTARIDITPEQYKANAIVKAAVLGVFAIPMLFIFPLLSPVILIIAVVVYNSENKKAGKKIKEKRQIIEYELPRFVSTVEKTLKHSRDVLYMLESYIPNAGEEFREELSITVADMRSSNYEAAVTRLEGRIGSPMMSDVCRGLIGILRGDEMALYWSTLSLKFADVHRQHLKQRAQKIPKKVKRLSVVLLACFMLVYVVVIMYQIIDSLGMLFG